MGDPASGGLDFGTSDWTVEGWVRGTSNAERVIASKRSRTGSAPYWRITVSDDAGQVGVVRANVFDGLTTVQAYGPAIRVDNFGGTTSWSCSIATSASSSGATG